MPFHGGPQGEAPKSVRRHREGEYLGKSLYGGFHGEERARQGKGLRIGSFE